MQTPPQVATISIDGLSSYVLDDIEQKLNQNNNLNFTIYLNCQILNLGLALRFYKILKESENNIAITFTDSNSRVNMATLVALLGPQIGHIPDVSVKLSNQDLSMGNIEEIRASLTLVNNASDLKLNLKSVAQGYELNAKVLADMNIYSQHKKELLN